MRTEVSDDSDGALRINQLNQERHTPLAVFGGAALRGVGGVVSGGERILVGNPPPTLGGYGAAGTTEISIVPHMAGSGGQSVSSNSRSPNSLVTVDVHNSFRVLDRNTELQTNLTPDTLSSTDVRQASHVTLTAPTAVNSLVLDGSQVITGKTSLAINSGALIRQ